MPILLKRSLDPFVVWFAAGTLAEPR